MATDEPKAAVEKFLEKKMSSILVEREEPIAVVLLNRPEAMNALNDELMTELVEALVALDDDEEVRCIVLGGSERAFAAGADIGEMAEATRDGHVRRRAASTAGTRSGRCGRRSSRRSPAIASAAAASWRWRAT